MKLIDRIRKLFQRNGVSEEAQRIFDASKTTEDVISGLETLIGRNRIEYEQRYDELGAVSALIEKGRLALKSGATNGTDEDRLMDSLELHQEHLGSLKRSVTQLKTSLRLHYLLVGQLREAQAASLRGVSENDIDGILEQASDALAVHARDMAAAAMTDTVVLHDGAAEDVVRAERRRQLLGEEPAARGAAVEEAALAHDTVPWELVAAVDARKSEKE